MSDEWDFWIEQLSGGAPETTPGRPHSGFYRDRYYAPTGDGKKREKRSRAVAIWQQDGEFICAVTAGYQPRHLDEIDALFSNCCRAPITRELFMSIQAGDPWPDEVPAADRVVSKGDNNPPEELTPDQALAAEIRVLEKQVREWLLRLPGSDAEKGITGKPQTKAEADLCANYATKFGELEKRAIEAHRAEKAPFLEAGRSCDAKWFAPVRDAAAELKKKIKAIGDIWLTKENARLAEEARLANEAARKAAEEAAVKDRAEADKIGAPPPPAVIVEEIKPQRASIGTSGRVITQRTRTVWIIEDLPSVATYFATLEAPPQDLRDTLEKLVGKVSSAGVKVPGTREDKISSAA